MILAVSSCQYMTLAKWYSSKRMPIEFGKLRHQLTLTIRSLQDIGMSLLQIELYKRHNHKNCFAVGRIYSLWSASPIYSVKVKLIHTCKKTPTIPFLQQSKQFGDQMLYRLYVTFVARIKCKEIHCGLVAQKQTPMG